MNFYIFLLQTQYFPKMAPRAFIDQIYIKQEKILNDSGPMSSGDIEDAVDLKETITTEDGSFQSFHEEISDESTSKYQEYDLRVDPLQDDRAIEIKLCPCSGKRPHMRAFHFAWWSYHVAFLMWYVLSICDIIHPVYSSKKYQTFACLNCFYLDLYLY